MSGPGQAKRAFSRRAVAIGGGIAAALGIAALGVTVPRLLKHRYRQSPYDDLFAQLVDRDAAVKVGRPVIEGIRANPAFTGVFGDRHIMGVEPERIAKELRRTLERRTLADVTASDIAEGRLAEVQGWVMPVTLVMLCALAAAVET